MEKVLPPFLRKEHLNFRRQDAETQHSFFVFGEERVLFPLELLVSWENWRFTSCHRGTLNQSAKNVSLLVQSAQKLFLLLFWENGACGNTEKWDHARNLTGLAVWAEGHFSVQSNCVSAKRPLWQVLKVGQRWCGCPAGLPGCSVGCCCKGLSKTLPLFLTPNSQKMPNHTAPIHKAIKQPNL